MLNPNVNALPAAITSGTTNNVPAHIEEVKDAINNGSLLRRLSQAQIDALSGVTRPTGLIVENLTTGATQKWDGAKWVDLALLPSYQAWTPSVWSIPGIDCTPVAGECRYRVLGKRVSGFGAVDLTLAGGAGSGRVVFPLPVAPRALAGPIRAIGQCVRMGPSFKAAPSLLLWSPVGAIALITSTYDTYVDAGAVWSGVSGGTYTHLQWSFDYESA